MLEAPRIVPAVKRPHSGAVVGAPRGAWFCRGTASGGGGRRPYVWPQGISHLRKIRWCRAGVPLSEVRGKRSRGALMERLA